MATILTPAQQKVFDAIKQFIESNKIPPSTREIAAMIDINAASVNEQIKRLEAKGIIRRLDNWARSIEIIACPEDLSESETIIEIPLIGRIAAGNPIFAEENFIEIIKVALKNTMNSRYFALKVIGQSMVDAAINDGDIVVVRQQSAALSGEIVAALIDNEATIKRLKIESAKILLLPENGAYQPIDVTLSENFRILGKVVKVISKQSLR